MITWIFLLVKFLLYLINGLIKEEKEGTVYMHSKEENKTTVEKQDVKIATSSGIKDVSKVRDGYMDVKRDRERIKVVLHGA